MIVLLLLLCFGDSVLTRYAAKDLEGLTRLYRQAPTREDSLLVRYRLYPLSRAPEVLQALPDDLASGSAREMALLAGLWGFRAAEAPFLKVIEYGRRADRFLRRARRLAPDEPFVLLVEGQSFLFRPAIAGRNERRALERFARLRAVLAREPACGTSAIEAETWTWYTLDKLKSPEAGPLRQQLLSRKPPRLFREFLGA